MQVGPFRYLYAAALLPLLLPVLLPVLVPVLLLLLLLLLLLHAAASGSQALKSDTALQRSNLTAKNLPVHRFLRSDAALQRSSRTATTPFLFLLLLHFYYFLFRKQKACRGSDTTKW